MKLLDLMEPEETVGNIWHDMASGMGIPVSYPDAACEMRTLQPSLSVLFRALGGKAGVEITECPATLVRHRRSVKQKVAAERAHEWIATIDGERLALPPVMAAFPDPRLNRDAYLWLVTIAALAQTDEFDPSGPGLLINDHAQIRANAASADRAFEACPGLRQSYAKMVEHCLAQRPNRIASSVEVEVEQAIRRQLGTKSSAPPEDIQPRNYLPFAPVPIWLRFVSPGNAGKAADDNAETPGPAPAAAMANRKLGERKDQDQTHRKDSFIIHRFESILSWVESMNINRSVDDNDDENAAKAADDQDIITLSGHDRRAATRLRLHLDLSPADADHEMLSGEYTYPEWNHRTRDYMVDHCRVLDAPAQPDAQNPFHPNQRQIRAVRRQFEVLRPRRILQPRQVDGAELDLDALVASKADFMATGRGSDRIWQDARQIERNLSVAFLIDTSRSTEAAIGETCVIDIARNAMAALSVGIDAAGDRLGIWGFSSLRRDRVFLTRCKDFSEELGPTVTANIGALKPGHYTRLGAAIRHVSAQLSEETTERKLLIVLTDGKPNDLDHYEGQHGIEDSHMAVVEARRSGQSLHGIIIDEDGQDWFARIFGRGGFSLLPDPERLTRVLPEIYRTLTQET